MPTRSLLFALAAAAWLLTTAASRGAIRDRRIVDTVIVGDPSSEGAHGYDDAGATRGVIDGRTFRQTDRWMHFVLSTFDDTDVTLALTFLDASGSAAEPRSTYDVVVEDSLVVPSTRQETNGAATVVEVDVPFRLTRGKTGIVVFVRARGGLTPPLHALRIIQDHHEVDLSPSPSGVAR